MKLLDTDEVIGTFLAYENDEILIASKHGFLTRYPISLVPLTSPRSKGVKAMNLVMDEIVSACIHADENKQLIVFSDTCAIKRMKLTDIDITGRPTKGTMICKKIKSKPYQIAHIALYDLNDEIVICNGEQHKLLTKDIALMSKDATFSNPVKIGEEYYILHMLEKVDIRAFEQTEPDKVMEYQELFHLI